MMLNKSNELVVVGGGIVGLLCALRLQQRGVHVTVLSKDDFGYSASFGNACHLATEQVFPLATPQLLKQLPKMLFDPLSPLRIDWHYFPSLFPWLYRLLCTFKKEKFKQIHHALIQLNSHSLGAWERLTRTQHIEHLICIQGSLLVAEKEKTLLTLKQKSTYLNELGVRNEFLDYAQIHEREPNLSLTQLGGLFYPKTGQLFSIRQVMTCLRKQFEQVGGRYLLDHEVIKINQVDNQFILNLKDKKIKATKLIIAMGAFSKEIVYQLSGIRVPLETERGYHYMLPYEKNVLAMPVSSADRHFIMTPLQEGLRLAGTVEYAGLQAKPFMRRAYQLGHLAKGMLQKELDFTQASTWMGNRPTLPDSLPVIDKEKNIIYAFGHQHLGVTQAALTAEIVESLFFNEATCIDITPYRLTRFH